MRKAESRMQMYKKIRTEKSIYRMKRMLERRKNLLDMYWQKQQRERDTLGSMARRKGQRNIEEMWLAKTRVQVETRKTITDSGEYNRG
jgi:hypothetical protein